MAGGLDGDNTTGMEIIKESFNMTDEDLAPATPELDWGDKDTGDESDFNEAEPSRERDTREPRSDPREYDISKQRGREASEAPQRVDPLKQNTLKFDPRATFRQDQKGNLLDTRTGELIARAGSEARIYQRVHKQASDYIRAATGNIQNQMQGERQKLDRAVEIGLGFEKELSELKGFVGKLNAFDLKREEFLEAAQYFKQAQSDPVSVLKNLLTRAAMSGIDISQLGFDPKGLDPKTIVEMVRKEINQGIEPVKQYTAQQQKAQEERQTESQYLQKAERQVSEFFGRTKEALPFTGIFHAVLSQPRFQNMSLGEIWDKIQLHLIRNGVDPRNPPSRSQRQRLNGTREVPSRSLPNGQGMAPSSSNGSGRGNAGPAHPSMSYDAIIREVLGNNARR
jgi:hypothetical protein